MFVNWPRESAPRSMRAEAAPPCEDLIVDESCAGRCGPSCRGRAGLTTFEIENSGEGNVGLGEADGGQQEEGDQAMHA
jgi:hypothetical protein